MSASGLSCAAFDEYFTMKRLKQAHSVGIVMWTRMWTIGTVGGWIAGAVVAAFIRTSTGTMPVTLFHAMIVGAFVGLLQWHLALSLDMKRIAWVLAIVLANCLIVLTADFAERHQLIPQVFDYYSVGLCASCDLVRLHET
jgi:ABC-type uncharacterized transport system permease subunit